MTPGLCGSPRLKVVASETLFDAVSQLMELSGLGNGYLRNEAFPLESRRRACVTPLIAKLTPPDATSVTCTEKVTLCP